VTFKVTFAGCLDFARHDGVIDQNYRVPELGKFLVILGAIIVVLGLLLWTGVGTGWLGRLPGDIRIERGNSAFYFPVVTCIIISIVLSLIFSLFRR
jgi:ribose/xylose/arabinose/galactoside ABC-type transport system permease subunit